MKTVSGQEVSLVVLGRENTGSFPLQKIPSGPYIASYNPASGSIDLTEVFRLYRDQEQAFTTPLIPFADGQSFSPLAAQVSGMNTVSIPVPSRLYTKYLAQPRALEGVRVAVKDLYDVAGVPSGLGNRAYWLTYEPRNVTAVSIQRLIDQVRSCVYSFPAQY